MKPAYLAQWFIFSGCWHSLWWKQGCVLVTTMSVIFSRYCWRKHSILLKEGLYLPTNSDRRLLNILMHTHKLKKLIKNNVVMSFLDLHIQHLMLNTLKIKMLCRRETNDRMFRQRWRQLTGSQFIRQECAVHTHWRRHRILHALGFLWVLYYDIHILPCNGYALSIVIRISWHVQHRLELIV